MSDADRLSADDITWELVADLGPDHSNLDVADIAVVALEEAQSYRILAQHAVHLLSAQDIQLKELRARYHQVLQRLHHNGRRRANADRRVRR